jgi:transposase InsO family protein
MISQIAETTGGSVRQVCSVLGLPRSSFYHAAKPTPLQEADERIGCLIEAIFKRHRGRYGYRRIREELADRDIVCAPARIRRIMAQRGLHAIQPKNYVPKTSDGRADKPSPNLLAGQPLPEVSQPRLGRGHYLHPNQLGVDVSGRRDRSLLQAHRGLEPGR